MKGEILLIIDSKVSDTAVFTTTDERDVLLKQFLNLQMLIEMEHPYSNVMVDVRMLNEANLSA